MLDPSAVIQLVDHCKSGNLPGVREAVARGEDVNHLNLAGSTGLMWALRNRHYHVAEYLVSVPGIDVNYKNGY